MTAVHVKKALQGYASPERAKSNAWFFKTGKGQYGEGDEFIGVTVPDTRKVAKQFVDLAFSELETLLVSKKHEHRLTALLILVQRYARAERQERNNIVSFYLAHLACVNNWDLVDLSAPHILGTHFFLYSNEVKLMKLARSKLLWERRVGIVATYTFIKNGTYAPTLQIAKILLQDREDLIHKAVGWMLREVGKKNGAVLRGFLTEHVSDMPRTMLRYAIERFPENERKIWLKKTHKSSKLKV
jgi:3-methyladenine DNA glycosylase AlkD